MHPRKNGSNVVVITSALHAVGRRFEPGIQYDSLFFALERCRRAAGVAHYFFTRASRGEDGMLSEGGMPFVNSRYIQNPPSYYVTHVDTAKAKAVVGVNGAAKSK